MDAVASAARTIQGGTGMSVIIKGMEMPEKCQYCCLLRYYHENGNIWCNANNALLRQGWYTEIDIKRPETCPLVEIPEKHGRLIDVDDAMVTLTSALEKATKEKDDVKAFTIGAIEGFLEASPIVIEAEGQE